MFRGYVGCEFCHVLFLGRAEKVSKEIRDGKVRGVNGHDKNVLLMVPAFLCGWIVLGLENCGAKERGNAIYRGHVNPERDVTPAGPLVSSRNEFCRLPESLIVLLTVLEGKTFFLLSTVLLGLALYHLKSSLGSLLIHRSCPVYSWYFVSSLRCIFFLMVKCPLTRF